MAPTSQKRDKNVEGFIQEDNGVMEKKKKAKKEVNDLYNSLITEARYIKGDDMDMTPFEEIPWIDESLIKHSANFHRSNVTFIISSCTFALLIGMCVKPNSAVLIKTGKLLDPEISFRRYVSTMQRIGKFFMFTLNKAGKVKSFNALRTVRKMHALATKTCAQVCLPNKLLQHSVHEPWKTELAAAIRKDLAHVDTSDAPTEILGWNPPVPISQFDMVMTQFGFFGTMFLFPDRFGITNPMEELKGVIHTWAIFGRILGIRDEFNVCINPDPVLFTKLYRNIILESMKTMDETVITIQNAFASAFTKRIPFMTYKSMLYAGLESTEGFTGENLWGLMSLRDKICYHIMIWWGWGMKVNIFYRYFMNFMTGIWLQVMFWLHLDTSLWDNS